jgi:MFS family permease
MDKNPETSTGFKSVIRSLKHRNFRLFFLGQSISLIGTWMQRIALSWLVYRLTNSPFLLGFVGFAGQIPTFLLAPFAGVLADRCEPPSLFDPDPVSVNGPGPCFSFSRT